MRIDGISIDTNRLLPLLQNQSEGPAVSNVGVNGRTIINDKVGSLDTPKREILLIMERLSDKQKDINPSIMERLSDKQKDINPSIMERLSDKQKDINPSIMERLSDKQKDINPSIRDRLNAEQEERDRQSVTKENGLLGLKAVFALDKDKNVVIRFLDEKGEVVRQIPPEEYIKMVKKFRENVESLFRKEV